MINIQERQNRKYIENELRTYVHEKAKARIDNGLPIIKSDIKRNAVAIYNKMREEDFFVKGIDVGYIVDIEIGNCFKEIKQAVFL